MCCCLWWERRCFSLLHALMSWTKFSYLYDYKFSCIFWSILIIIKVKQWLFQYEKLPFVEFGNVQWVSWNLFLIRTPILFLSNPHLSSSGERMDLAITSTSTILQLIQDFANPLITILHRSIHPSIWNELLKILVDTVSHLIVQNNQFVAAIAGGKFF